MILPLQPIRRQAIDHKARLRLSKTIRKFKEQEEARSQTQFEAGNEGIWTHVFVLHLKLILTIIMKQSPLFPYVACKMQVFVCETFYIK